MNKGSENFHKKTAVHQFFRNVLKLVLYPDRFYEELIEESSYTNAVVFLFIICIVFSILASIFSFQKHVFFTLIFFLNAFFVPFITAFILYLVSILLSKNIFTYQTLFKIIAYANVTLLAAWIPGLSWMAGLWKFYLIGLGMVKVGRISGIKAFMSLVATATILLLMIHFIQSVLKQ